MAQTKMISFSNSSFFHHFFREEDNIAIAAGM